MKLLLPKEILDWLNSVRGGYSIQAYVIKCLFEKMNNSKNYNTNGSTNDKKNREEVYN